MNDHSSVVDDLRSFLQSSDQMATEQISGRASLYAQLCTDVNQRLRRCEDFLKKGLRAEAIHYAQTEPPLLEIFATLDFPERSQLDEVATAYGLTVPPRLNAETARALQQAIAEAEPLADVLRQHRLLALGRAPLPERLRVLRKLCEADPNNPLWPDSVRTFEKARLRTIEIEAEDAIRKNDTNGITRLHAEITVNRWLAKPAPAFVKRLTEAAQKTLRSQAREDLVKLEQVLNNAYNQCDLDACRRYRDQWNQQVGLADLPANDPLHEQVAPALQWADGQDALAAADQAFAADVNALETALRGVLTRPKLEELMRTVQRHGRGFSGDLVERCGDRRDQMVRGEKLRKVLIIAGAAAAVLAAAAVAFVVLRQGSLATEADNVVGDIQRMVRNREFDGVRAYVDQLSPARPELFERAEVKQAVKEMEASLREEELRVKEFRAAYDEKRLNDANGLALTAEEKGLVIALRKTLADEGDAKKQGELKAFSERLAPVRDEVAKAEQEANPTDKLFSSLLAKLGVLGKEASQLGAKPQTEVEGLTKQVKAAELAHANSRRRTELEAKIDGSTPLAGAPLTEYVANLELFTKEFPEGNRTSDFKKASAEPKRWQAVLDWNQLLKDAGARPLLVEPKSAKARADSLNKFLDAHGDFVEGETARQYKTYLEALAERDEENPESGATAVKNAFTSPDFTLVWTFKYDHKTNYYYTKDDVPEKIKQADKDQQDRISIKFLLDLEDNTDKKTVFLRAMCPPRMEDLARAPQAVLAKAWEDAADRPWEERVVTQMEKVRADKRLDPIAKFKLLKSLLQGGTRASPGLKQALGKHLTLVDAPKFDVDAKWINPDSALDETRRKAQVALDAWPDTKTAVAQAAKHAKDLETRLAGSQAIPVGWLARDRKGAWQCRPGARSITLTGDHELYMLNVTGETASWQPIGQFSGGQVRLQSDASRAFVEGRLIFARRIGQP